MDLMQASTSDIIGLKKTLTGSLPFDNTAINILGHLLSTNISVRSTGAVTKNNRSTTISTSALLRSFKLAKITRISLQIYTQI